MRRFAAITVASLWASLTWAAPFDDAAEALRGLPDNWPEANLRAWVNDGGARRLRVGDRLVFHFFADRDAHVTLFLADSHGVVTAVVPKLGARGSFIAAGRKQTFPPPGEAFALRVKPPLGRAFVVAVTTERPVPVEFLAAFAKGGPNAMVAAEKVVPLVNAFRQRSGALGGRGNRAAIPLEIVGRDSAAQLRPSDVVAFFKTRSRAFTRPKLDRPVNFEFNSHRLTEDGRRLLNVVGAALQDPGLKGSRFVVNGHTDDVGSPSYNIALSQRRADATRAYLIERFSIDPSRLETRASGEAEPLVDGEDDVARAANRRVEIINLSK